MAYCVTVLFKIVPGQMDAFLPLMRANAKASVRDEPNCLQFDVCTGENHVFLYEIYTDRAAFDLHLRAPHFLAFDAATQAMVASKHIDTFAEVDHNLA